MLNWLYTAVSWILLRWHDVWSAVFDGRKFLATSWDWILAIIFLVVTIRLILFPIFVKQIKSQRAMQALQPKLKELQEKHKGDRETLQKEMMELYQKEKVNPLMGCLPILLQIPVFISLFWILRRLDPQRPAAVRAGEATLEGSKTTLYTWTFEQFESASLAQLFGAPIAARFFDENFGRFAELGASLTTTRIVLGVLVLLMMATTFLTARQMVLKTGWATDPTQLMMQRLMVYGLPFMLLFSGLFFPVGVILYWVTNNLFSLGQQQWVLRKYPPPPTVNAAAGKATSGKAAAGKPAQARKGVPGKAAQGKKGAPDKGGAPAVDGRSLAPKPGAKPVNPKKLPPKKRPSSGNIPPKSSGNIPPKRKSPTTGKG